MNQEGDVPEPDEVREQLTRILASRTFRKKPVRRRLLERLVNDTLAGVVGSEDY